MLAPETGLTGGSGRVVIARRVIPWPTINTTTIGLISKDSAKHQTMIGIPYMIIIRGTILNRTYGTHKNLYKSLFLLTIFGPIYYGPP